MTFPLLSVLLMGMVPVGGPATMNQVSLQGLPIAPPAQKIQMMRDAQNTTVSLSASGILVTDLDSGQTVYGRLPNQRRPIASLTKLMTAILIVENHQLDEMVKIPADIGKVEGQSAHLKPGEHYSVGDLLSAMLVDSANDAASALASYDSGTTSAFVQKMNARSAVLGLHDTSFTNPIGLDDDRHYSTPQDLAWLATFALRKEVIFKRMSSPVVTIRSREGDVITLTHTHQLLHKPSSIIAGKTGTTDAAGQCLLSVVQEDGHTYVVILLGSSERYRDMKEVLVALSKLPV